MFFKKADSVGMPASFWVYMKNFECSVKAKSMFWSFVWGVRHVMYTVNILWGMVNRMKI